METYSNFKEEWITGEDVIKILRISTRTLFSYRSKGILSYSQIGRKISYKLSDVYALLERHYVKPTDWKGGL
jgi:DNA-binding transcriptional MerR regulator